MLRNPPEHKAENVITIKKKHMKYLLISTTLILGSLLNIANAQSIESYMEEASEARDQMEFDKASELYTKIIELDSHNIEALYNRGWCENFWDKSKGIEDFNKVLELDSLHEGALQSLASTFSILGKSELAEEYKMRAIAINPKTASNLLYLARKANSSGEYEEAIRLCNESIELEDDSQIWLQLLDRAEAHYNLGKYEEAIDDFEKCFNEFGHGMYSCSEYEMCGDAYKAIENSDKACEYWIIAVGNDDPEFDPASENVKLKAKKNCNK